jgi:hypothetical protein
MVSNLTSNLALFKIKNQTVTRLCALRQKTRPFPQQATGLSVRCCFKLQNQIVTWVCALSRQSKVPAHSLHFAFPFGVVKQTKSCLVPFENEICLLPWQAVGISVRHCFKKTTWLDLVPFKTKQASPQQATGLSVNKKCTVARLRAFRNK